MSKTLHLLENRVAFSEDKPTEVVDFIKNNDLSFVIIDYIYQHFFIETCYLGIT